MLYLAPRLSKTRTACWSIAEESASMVETVMQQLLKRTRTAIEKNIIMYSIQLCLVLLSYSADGKVLTDDVDAVWFRFWIRYRIGLLACW